MNYEVEGQMTIFDLDSQYGKMCQVPSPQTTERISESSLRNWQESKIAKYQYLDLRQVNGNKPERWLVMDGQLHGEHLMLNFGESPKEERESSLSQILEMNVPERYYLSPIACQGILRRASKRGKALPPILKEALEAQAKYPIPYKSEVDAKGGGKGPLVQVDKSATLTVAQTQTLFQPVVFNGVSVTSPQNIQHQQPGDACYTLTTDSRNYLVQAETEKLYDMSHANDVIRECDVCPTLQHRMGTGGNQIPLHMDAMNWDGSKVCPTLTKSNAGGNQRMPDKDNFNCILEPKIFRPVEYADKCGTLCARDYKGIGNEYVNENICVVETDRIRYIVRRLTPTECGRLQGMPDGWTSLHHIEDMSDEDYEFWLDAHRVYADINGKSYKQKTKKQMIDWYNELETDGAKYKAYGNGMALPCVLVPVSGVSKHGAKTMASLFDGIGGFPLAGLMNGIKTLWTSEIELFPIAVTKERFE